MKKRFVALQDDSKDCGAASLSSIIKYYGGYVPMETLRNDTCTNQSGTTAYHLLAAASKYNLQGNGVKFDNKNDFLSTKITFPVIAHLQVENFTHFVVIYKINKDNTLLIMDPAVGYQNISINNFYKLWTGIMLFFYKSGIVPKIKKNKGVLSYLWKLLLTEKKKIFKIIVVSILLLILSLLTSFYFKITLNDIISRPFVSYILIFIVIIVLKTICEYIKNNLINKLNNNIDKKVINPFLKHIVLLPLSYTKSRTTGDIITRIDELKNIKTLFINIFIFITLDLLLAFVASVFLLNINYKLCLILYIMIISYFLITLLFSNSVKENIKKLIHSESDFNSNLLDNVNALESIKNLKIEDKSIKKLRYSFNLYVKKDLDLNNKINKINFYKNLILETGIFIINTVGIFFTLENKMNLIDLMTFNYLYIYLINPFKNLIDIIPEISYVKESYNKISEFLDVKEETFDKGINFTNGDLQIKNLNYSYNKVDNLISDLSFLIKKGEHVFLQGKSGCGKTTICKLIYRYYNFDYGDIQINNKSIKDYNLNSLRNKITYLSQNEKLFSGTIKDNIYCNRDIKSDIYEKVIKVCFLENLINKLPLKDDTYLVNSECLFSGGECQRIILARSLLKGGNIIILDEALSEVEEKLEAKIIQNIRKNFKDKTIIYISHRNQGVYFDKVINI